MNYQRQSETVEKVFRKDQYQMSVKVHAPRTQEAKGGGSEVQGYATSSRQPGL